MRDWPSAQLKKLTESTYLDLGTSKTYFQLRCKTWLILQCRSMGKKGGAGHALGGQKFSCDWRDLPTPGDTWFKSPDWTSMSINPFFQSFTPQGLDVYGNINLDSASSLTLGPARNPPPPFPHKNTPLHCLLLTNLPWNRSSLLTGREKQLEHFLQKMCFPI